MAHGRHAGDGAGAGGRHEEDKNVGGKIHAQHLCDLTVGETVYFPENRWLDVPCGYLGGGRSPTLGFAVFEEGHQLVQDLHELVDMGAGLRYQISTLFEGQVRRNRGCGSARASERRRGSDGDTGPNSCIGGASPTGR